MDTTTALLKKGKVQMRRVIGLSSTIKKLPNLILIISLLSVLVVKIPNLSIVS